MISILLGKTQVPNRIDKTLTSRFCKDDLGPKFQHGIRACRIQGPPTYLTLQAGFVIIMFALSRIFL